MLFCSLSLKFQIVAQQNIPGNLISEKSSYSTALKFINVFFEKKKYNMQTIKLFPGR